MRIAILFHRLGPYHCARLNAVNGMVDTVAIEGSGVNPFYDWEVTHRGATFKRVTLFPTTDITRQSKRTVAARVRNVLADVNADVVAVNGWSDHRALAAIDWCSLRGVPIVLMSDSTREDEARLWWKEALKKRIVSLCQTAIVAGRRHSDYIEQLGVRRNCIFTGYDVVDNHHFKIGAKKAVEDIVAVRTSLQLPDNYFLASGRFVSKKNFGGLLSAYAIYKEKLGNSAWHLVLLGDGELRGELERTIKSLDISDYVSLPGFKQYDELPAYYGLAKAFVHPSIVDQWGLVVNEAMAAGLPVLVSRQCGCAPDLVIEGYNGFTFDPRGAESLANLMTKVSSADADLTSMGNASSSIIANWTPAHFAEALVYAASSARRVAARRQRNIVERAFALVFSSEMIRVFPQSKPCFVPSLPSDLTYCECNLQLLPST